MYKNTRFLQPVVAAMLFFTSLLSVYGQTGGFTETSSDMSKRLSTEAQQLFESKSWADLDELIDKSHERKTLSPGGQPIVSIYLSSVSARVLRSKEEPDAKWYEYYTMLGEWEKAIPDSLYVKTLQIKFWTSFAWKARGTGYRNTVTEEAWEIFKERLLEANVVYEDVQKEYPEGIPLSSLYVAAMTTALGQKWDNDKTLDELVIPAAKAWPENINIYTTYAHRLQPQWNGKKGDGYRFYIGLKDIIGEEMGQKMGALCILYKYGASINTFQYDLVDWDDMKSGLLAHLKENPNAGEFIKKFIVFGTRYESVDKLSGYVAKVSPDAFTKFSESLDYGKAVSASLKAKSSSASLDYYYRPDTSYYIQDIKFATSQPNVDYYAYTQGWYGLAVVDSKNGSILAHHVTPEGQSRKNYYHGLAMSPSGKYIVVGGLQGGSNSIVVYEYADGKLTVVKSLTSPVKYMNSAIFSEDEKTIFFAGLPKDVKVNKAKKGKKGKKGKNQPKAQSKKTATQAVFYRWSWESKKPQLTHQVDWLSLPRTVLVPGSSKVFCYSGKNCFSYDYKEAKPVAKKVGLTFDGEAPQILDAHYAKELDSIALLCAEGNRIALIDPKTHKLRFSQKDIGFANQAYQLTGFPDKKNGYTFCVTGKSGYMSLCHYIKGETPKINYESTWVNIDYDPTYVGVTKGEDGGVKIVQTYKGGMIGSYSHGEKQVKVQVKTLGRRE